MAGRARLEMLEERIDALTAERAPNPIRDAIERMTLEEIQHLTALYETDGADAFAAALIGHMQNAETEH